MKALEIVKVFFIFKNLSFNMSTRLFMFTFYPFYSMFNYGAFPNTFDVNFSLLARFVLSTLTAFMHNICRVFPQLILVGSRYDGPFCNSLRNFLSLTIVRSPVTIWPTSVFRKGESSHEQPVSFVPVSNVRSLMFFCVVQYFVTDGHRVHIAINNYRWLFVQDKTRNGTCYFIIIH